MAENAVSELPSLHVTTLSQYVRMRNCDRFLRFRLQPQEAKAMRDRWHVDFQPLTPLLQDRGQAFEKEVEARLSQGVPTVISIEKYDYDAVEKWLLEAREPVILLQAPIKARLGNYRCIGEADVIRLARDAAGRLHVIVADIKASRKERMQHRLQVAAYAYLIQRVAEDAGVRIGSMKGRILHKGTDDNSMTLDDEGDAFDLDIYLHALKRLAVGPESILNRVADQAFEDVPYHLGYWCDGCPYNALCMHDSAARKDLSLVPHLTAVEKRTLKRHGIQTMEGLAGLMELPYARNHKLTVAEGQKKRLRRLSKDWPLGPNLPVLVQRARRALCRFDGSVKSKTFLFNSGFGTMPCEEEHPGLVKLFIDVQHDYLEDRLYLLAARIAGPRGKRVVVRGTGRPPTQDSERQMVSNWVLGVLAAIGQVAEGTKAYLHLYLYDPHDQSVLLDGLKRHLDTVATVPGFFDLLTQSPALTQPVLSFLSRELATRMNLGTVCTPLHEAARMMGFSWQDGRHAYNKLFRTRLFDNRGYMLRLENGTMKPKPENVPIDDPNVLAIEAASRFNSQIPLEYAYGAWGHLKSEGGGELGPFKAVNEEMLEGFAAHRVLALVHIEGRFKNKARKLNKAPFDLRGLYQPRAPEPTLARSLQEFLAMEHHTTLQERLQVYALPIDQRVTAGDALLLRFQRTDEDGKCHWFQIAFDGLGLDPDLTMKTFRQKQGSWMVLNVKSSNPSANQIKHGTLMVIDRLANDRAGLRERWVNARDARFKYYHRRLPELREGELYTLDKMADGLNTDKQWEALKNAVTNVVYDWLVNQPRARERSDSEKAFAREFADYVDEVESPRALTPKQRRAVRSLPGERVLLVQGPPGTGKSHTLAWVVLCRLLERVKRGMPFRVAVSCTTHKAVLVAMESVLTKWTRMLGRPTQLVSELEMRGLLIAKLDSDGASRAWPDGLEVIDPFSKKRTLDDCLERHYLILGATPGYLYNLAKYRGEDKGSVDWSRKSFDLLVIDEASQMSVPEALLASAFLKVDGALLVVGDHRQMPPITAHDWEKEEKRTTKAARPYLSLFEFLVERGFERISLDQSFRLNRRLAEFLREHIYSKDDIPFFSNRTDRLPACTGLDGYVDAVLSPDYPIVFIEHAETASQQYNELELEIVKPLVEACQEQHGLDGLDGLGVVVPHRAQRALLQDHFPRLADDEAIDTVERFQGGERDVIIVSATASDPDYVLAEADFLLDSNRLNVAISRPRKKLVVVASRSITGLLVSDLDTFERASVWKLLFHRCTRETVWKGKMLNHEVVVRGCSA